MSLKWGVTMVTRLSQHNFAVRLSCSLGESGTKSPNVSHLRTKHLNLQQFAVMLTKTKEVKLKKTGLHPQLLDHSVFTS